MNTKTVRSILIAIAMLGCAVLSAAEAPKEDTAAATKLIVAIAQADYEAFISDGDVSFQQLKREQFKALSAQLAPRLQAGYEIAYLGELKQKGYRVTLWKLSFKDGDDDALATLSVKAGKVGGFFIR